MSESQGFSSDKTIIGPGSESGFSPRDVLNEAEEGDEIYLEMEFHDHKFERGRGTVANVIEESVETERMARKTFQIEGVGENEMVNIALESDTESAYVTLREQVRFVKRGVEDYVFGELDDLTMCELRREEEA